MLLLEKTSGIVLVVKNGCFETFASATAIVKHYEKMLSDENIAVEYEISSREIFDRAAKGEELPLKAVDRYTTYLATGIVNIINMIDPEVITLGGGVSAAGDFLLNMLKEKVKKDLFVKGLSYCKN